MITWFPCIQPKSSLCGSALVFLLQIFWKPYWSSQGIFVCVNLGLTAPFHTSLFNSLPHCFMYISLFSQFSCKSHEGQMNSVSSMLPCMVLTSWEDHIVCELWPVEVESHFKMTGHVFIIDLNLEESISGFQCLCHTNCLLQPKNCEFSKGWAHGRSQGLKFLRLVFEPQIHLFLI